MKYSMQDGTIVDTDNATQTWPESTSWDGSNYVSDHTQDQWSHQQMYRSRKGRYYLERWSNVQGRGRSVEWLSPQAAARWLLLNEDELPEDLAGFADEVSE